MVIYYLEHVYLISNSDAKDSICNWQDYRLCSLCSSTAADANTACSPGQLQILSLGSELLIKMESPHEIHNLGDTIVGA